MKDKEIFLQKSKRPVSTCIVEPSGRLKTPTGPFRLLRRVVHLLYVLLLHLVVHSFLDRSYGDDRRIDRWERILYVFEDSGPTFVKLGQILSQRSEIPKLLADRLENLLDWGPVLSHQLIRERIEEEIGSVDHVFAEFNDLPISSASLAQVHEAKLNSGEKVAVKVRKPGLVDRIECDLVLLRVLCKFIGELPPRILRPFPGNPKFVSEFVETFERNLRREVDFKREGEFIEKFEKVWKHNPDILVPDVHWNYTTKKVLVMEFMEGLQFNYARNPEEWKSAGIDPRKVYAHYLQAGMESIIGGLAHADTHPANLKGTDDGKLVVLDFGMCQELEDEEIEAFLEVINALRWGEIEEMVKLILGRMAYIPHYIERDEIIERACLTFSKYIKSEGNGVPVLERSVWKEDDPRETIIDDIIQFGLEHDVSIRHRFVLLFKSITYQIQAGKRLWPGAPFFDMIVPYVYSFNANRDLDSGKVDHEAAIKDAISDVKMVEKQEFFQ